MNETDDVTFYTTLHFIENKGIYYYQLAIKN